METQNPIPQMITFQDHDGRNWEEETERISNGRRTAIRGTFHTPGRRNPTNIPHGGKKGLATSPTWRIWQRTHRQQKTKKRIPPMAILNLNYKCKSKNKQNKNPDQNQPTKKITHTLESPTDEHRIINISTKKKGSKKQKIYI